MPCHPTPIRFQRLLLTGAAGGLGRELRTRLKAYCTTLRLSDIAEQLTLSPKTVSVYRSRVLEKMQLSNNSELTVYAIRNGLVGE